MFIFLLPLMLFEVGSAIRAKAKIEQKVLAQERKANRACDLMLNLILVNTHFTYGFSKG